MLVVVARHGKVKLLHSSPFESYLLRSGSSTLLLSYLEVRKKERGRERFFFKLNFHSHTHSLPFEKKASHLLVELENINVEKEEIHLDHKSLLKQLQEAVTEAESKANNKVKKKKRKKEKKKKKKIIISFPPFPFFLPSFFKIVNCLALLLCFHGNSSVEEIVFVLHYHFPYE